MIVTTRLSTSEGLAPHAARGVAKVHVGPRSGQEIPDGPVWEPPLDVAGLEHVLAGLRRFADGERCWGIRSTTTGGVYPFASSYSEALLVREGTGTPERYEIVHLCDGEWISSSGVCFVNGTTAAGAPKLGVDGCSLASDETARHSGGPGVEGR